MSNVITLSPSNVESVVREFVASGKLRWTKHSKERMSECGVTIQQVRHCLQKGRIIEGPFLTYEDGGGYKMIMEKVVAGDLLRVVICLDELNEKLRIITVFYCD